MSDSTCPTSLFDPEMRPVVELGARVAFENPFLPGHEPLYADAVCTVIGSHVERACERLLAGASPSDADRALYVDAGILLLRTRHAPVLDACTARQPLARVEAYGDFAREHARLFEIPGLRLDAPAPAHLFAWLVQTRRAWRTISTTLLGGSAPMAGLRASVWRAIFTHDMRRYVRSLYARMEDNATLITGPTGTGKELCARSIGISRYVHFDAAGERFVSDPSADFHPLNVSALASSIIESELFGHRRGAFTGALGDHAGWFEVCKPGGTVFLDEIGEIDPAIQVKLLRVLQERRFQRLGDTQEQPFHGRVVAATHQDLAERIRSRAFRQDFYYRLCSIQIRTPSLREQLDAAPEERRALVLHIAEKVAGAAEAEGLAGEVEAWIDANLPPDYAWPGNVRELEQCVRNVLVRNSYRPLDLAGELGEDIAHDVNEGNVSEEELLARYTNKVHAKTGSVRETARRLGIDRRTVAARVDHALAAKLARRRSGRDGG